MKNKKAVVSALAVLASVMLVIKFRNELIEIGAVFALAFGFMLLLMPLCKKLEARGISPSRAAVCSVCMLLLIVLVLVFTFLPYVFSRLSSFIQTLTPMAAGLYSGISQWAGMGGVTGSTNVLASAAAKLTAVLARSSVSVAAQLGRIVFSIVVAYYLLREREKAACHMLLCIPLRWRKAVLQALRGCGNAVLGYVSGILKTSAFIAAATYLGLLMIGIKEAFILAVFMGLFEILPYIGPVLGAIPILLISLSQGIRQMVMALVMIVAIQQIEGSFISPYFTASSTSIHPLTALVSVFVFGKLMGLWGILLAVPLIVTMRSLYWSSARVRYMAKNPAMDL